MPSFSIHQFSSGIINPQQNKKGQWVSGGYGKEIAKESYKVPPEIKNAVNTSLKGGWRGFGIPDAYLPQAGDFALIAREVENYCVLAVANQQQDDANRRFIAYRYFWLDKQQFKNQDDFGDFDGIATLLYHWKQTGNPQYNIEEWTNSRLYTTSWDRLTQWWTKTKFFQQNSTRIQPLIFNINQNNQSLNYSEPLMCEANTIGFNLAPEEIHCLAIQYSHIKNCSINWAWNVRRLENMQDLRVIDCADDKALNWFNQELIKRRPIPIPRPNESGGEVGKVGGVPNPSEQAQKTREIKEFLLKFRGTFEEGDVLKLMDYYQEHGQNIFKLYDQYAINSFLSEIPRPRDYNIKYVTLLTALAPNKIPEMLSRLMALNKNLKNKFAIEFLDELLEIVTQNLDSLDDPTCELFCKNFTHTRWKLFKLHTRSKLLPSQVITPLNNFNRLLGGLRTKFNKSTKSTPSQSDENPTIDSDNNIANQASQTIEDLLLKFSGDFTKEDVFQLMNYYQENENSIVNFEDENAINNLRNKKNEKNEMSQYKADIKYAILLTALVPKEKEDILHELMELNDNLKKDVAIKFLDEFLKLATENLKGLNHRICGLFCKNFTDTKFRLKNSLKSDSRRLNPNMLFLLPLLMLLVSWIYLLPNISISRTNISTSIITISTRRKGFKKLSFKIPTTLIGKQVLLADLLNEYDKQYEILKPLEPNQERNIVKLKKKILAKLVNAEAKKYIQQLDNSKPEQVQDARDKEIYINLEQFTPTIIVEKLPVLKLGMQDEVNVTTLQKALKRNDNYNTGQQPDELGNFDLPTKKGVENLQGVYIETFKQKQDSKKTKVKEDGIVGANTWNLLVGRIKDLQVEMVYKTLINHLRLENYADENIVSEIKECRDSSQNEKALMFVNCLEELNRGSSLTKLLNKYESQYKELEKLDRNDEKNIEKIKTFKTVLYRYNEKILNKFREIEADEYIEQLKNGYSSQVKDAREKEIYINLKQFTPEIKTENLPVLQLGKPEQDTVDVTALQNALKRNRNYFPIPETEEPGNFDLPTKEAVENFQRAYIEALKQDSKTTEIEPDGIVGANTWNLLVNRIKDLQVEIVYEILRNHLIFDKQIDDNIVREIKKCRDNSQNENALKFVNCLEKWKKEE